MMVMVMTMGEKKHDDEVYQIVQNARQVSLKYLHPFQHICYSSHLLIEYVTLYQYNED